MSQTKFKTVAELLGDPQRWCQNDCAQDAEGRPVTPRCDQACRWCLVGAIEKVYGYGLDQEDTAHWEAWRRLEVVLNCGAIGFNDGHTHAEVLAAVRAAGI